MGIVCKQCKIPPPKSWKERPPLRAGRQNQILELLRQAKGNKQIAYELRLSEGTVKVYMNLLMRKTGMPNRVALAIWAERRAAAAERSAA